MTQCTSTMRSFQPRATRGSTRFASVVFWSLMLTVVTGSGHPTWAQADADESSGNATNVSERSSGDPATSGGESNEQTETREDMATILTILLTGVALIGVALIAATMIWGAKLRRLARMQPSEATKLDELWYLKTPPPEESDGGTTKSPSSDHSSSAANEENAP